MRDIEKADGSSSIRLDVIINRPFFITVVSFAFVVGVFWVILGERVRKAFVEDFRGIIWSIGSLVTRFRVREAQIIQQPRQVVRVVLDLELGVYELLYLLFLPGLTLFEQVKQTCSLLLGARNPSPPLFQSLAQRLLVD